MLQFIREKSQGWFAWIILGGISAIFALWGVKSYLYSADTTQTVAQVEGTEITQQQLSMAYNQLKRQQQIMLGANYDNSEASANALKEAALQSLISNIVLTKAAESAGFNVAPELVDTTLAKMPVFQVNGAFSQERFEQALNAMLYSPDEFFNEINNHILINQIQFGIVNSAFALPDEVDQAIQLMNQMRTFDYAIIPASRYLSQVSLQKNAVDDYYTKHSDDFKIPGSISLEYVELSVSNLIKNIHPTDSEVKSFYTNNISSYTQPAEWKVSRILVALPMRSTDSQKKLAEQKINMIATKITSGVDFTSLANQYSDDQATSHNGGDLPWQNLAQFSNVWKTILPTLKRIGDVSSPVYVPGQGYEIIKIDAIKPAKITPFSEVKDKVFQMYRQQQAEQKFADLSDQLSNLTYESPNTLEPAAKKLGLTIQTTERFTQSGGQEKVTQNPKILQAAFSDEVAVQNNNSDPINLNDNDVIVLRAKQYIPPQVKPLAEVKSIIESKLRLQAAMEKAKDQGRQMMVELAHGQALDAVAKKYQTSWRHVSNAKRQSSFTNANILMLAFQSPTPSQALSRVNTGDSLRGGDFAIVSLTQVTLGAVKSLSDSQRAIFARGIQNGIGQLDYMLYVNGLMQKAKIKGLSQSK